MKFNRESDRIGALNDSFRQTFIGGRVMKTVGVAAQDEAVQQNLISKVRAFGKFEPGNDPYGEHDFGSVKLTAWTLYSDIRQDLVADGTSADFARYISAANPAAQPAVNSCFASTAALTGFPVNQPGFIGSIPVPLIFRARDRLHL